MNRLKIRLFATLIGCLLIGGNLRASTMTLQDLPSGDTDTISIQLDPLSGSISGNPGDTVGWGFTVTWTSTDGDWMTFANPTYLEGPVGGGASETNPDLGTYTDYMNAQGGPDDYSLSSTDGPWTESFDATSQLGVGSYQITSDPTIAVPDAEDTGQIVFNFQVYDGDPNAPYDPANPVVQLGDSSYSYATPFSVSVESALPEPAGYALLLAGIGVLATAKWRRRAARPPSA